MRLKSMLADVRGDPSMMFSTAKIKSGIARDNP
jgi:hypothetical protein